MGLIQPVRCGEALRDEMLATTVGDGAALWWLGQSGFVLKTPAGVVVFDPYLSDSLTRKYAASDKPHVRMTELVMEPRLLDFVDVVTSSHNHTDHLDAETLRPLMEVNPGVKLVIPEANRAFVAERLGCDATWPVGVDDGVSQRVAAFTIDGIAAAHDRVERDEAGRCRYLGYVVRFDAGGREMRVYFSGDTLMHDALVPALKAYGGLDVAMLPINGRRPERRVAGNLFGDEAARLAHEVGARLVVPCHYEMFTFNTESPALFTRTCEELGQAYRVLRCGECVRLMQGG